MRRTLIAAASVLALMTGSAIAQSTAPATGNPATGGPTATNMNQTGQSNLTGGQMASAENLMGKNVYGKDNEKVGEVEDVIIDANGQAKQLVISSGGFLGIGEKQIAVDYNQARWDQEQNRIHLSGLGREDVKNLPEFQYSDTTTSLNRNKDRNAGSTAGSTNDTASPANTGAGAPTGSGSPSGGTQNKSGQ